MPRVDARNRVRCRTRRASGTQPRAWRSEVAWRFGSGRAPDGATRAALAVELDAVAQRPLTTRAARVTKLDMMGPARAGRLFLGVAGAAIPSTFSESHPRSSRKDARRCSRPGCKRYARGTRSTRRALARVVAWREGISLPTPEAL